jgi:hypothetical protein
MRPKVLESQNGTAHTSDGEVLGAFRNARAVACVFAAHRVIAEALTQMLEALGYAAVVCRPGDGNAPRGNVAVWDLSAHTPPFPAPPGLPTVALATDSDHDASELLALGYRGYLRPRAVSSRS